MSNVNTKNIHRVKTQVTLTTELNTVLNIIAKDQKVTKAQLIEYVLGNFATQLVKQVADAKGIKLDSNGNAVVESTEEAPSHDTPDTSNS
jgi:predicted DNA-binding ribbon-helix-helix protein